jgi:hypothetical protein
MWGRTPFAPTDVFTHPRSRSPQGWARPHLAPERPDTLSDNTEDYCPSSLNCDSLALNCDSSALNHDSLALNCDSSALNRDSLALNCDSSALNHDSLALNRDRRR